MASVKSEKQIQELFISYFGRPADAAGLAYYANELDKGALDASSIADGFGKSAEAAPIVAKSTDDYVADVYKQAFGRDYDATTDGTFWKDSIDAGTFTKEKAMLSILDGASGNDAKAVENKGQVAKTFTAAQETGSKSYDATALAAAKAVMSGVSSDAASLATGTSAATTAVANATPMTAAAAASPPSAGAATPAAAAAVVVIPATTRRRHWRQLNTLARPSCDPLAILAPF